MTTRWALIRPVEWQTAFLALTVVMQLQQVFSQLPWTII